MLNAKIFAALQTAHTEQIMLDVGDHRKIFFVFVIGASIFIYLFALKFFCGLHFFAFKDFDKSIFSRSGKRSQINFVNSTCALLT